MLWQFFSGMAYYEHRLLCDATQIGRFRVGEAGLEQMLKATINVAVGIEAIKPEKLERVLVVMRHGIAPIRSGAKHSNVPPNVLTYSIRSGSGHQPPSSGNLSDEE